MLSKRHNHHPSSSSVLSIRHHRLFPVFSMPYNHHHQHHRSSSVLSKQHHHNIIMVIIVRVVDTTSSIIADRCRCCRFKKTVVIVIVRVVDTASSIVAGVVDSVPSPSSSSSPSVLSTRYHRSLLPVCRQEIIVNVAVIVDTILSIVVDGTIRCIVDPPPPPSTRRRKAGRMYDRRNRNQQQDTHKDTHTFTHTTARGLPSQQK